MLSCLLPWAEDLRPQKLTTWANVHEESVFAIENAQFLHLEQLGNKNTTNIHWSTRVRNALFVCWPVQVIILYAQNQYSFMWYSFHWFLTITFQGRGVREQLFNRWRITLPRMALVPPQDNLRAASSDFLANRRSGEAILVTQRYLSKHVLINLLIACCETNSGTQRYFSKDFRMFLRLRRGDVRYTTMFFKSISLLCLCLRRGEFRYTTICLKAPRARRF